MKIIVQYFEELKKQISKHFENNKLHKAKSYLNVGIRVQDNG